MKLSAYILLLVAWTMQPFSLAFGQPGHAQISFDFYGDTISFTRTNATSVDFADSLSPQAIRAFYDRMMASDYEPAVNAMLAYKSQHHPDDWIYYQLVRRTAQCMSPKADNYFRYTLYKWFLLSRSGYDATLNIAGDKLLFYVQSDDEIYDIPSFSKGDKQYICLNYHDYGYNVDFKRNGAYNVAISVPGAEHSFSYKVTNLPSFRSDHYSEKVLKFSYNDMEYHFRIKINNEIKKIFNNYPVADYKLYFDAPLSNETYNSLIPQLRRNLHGLSTRQGVDYLMHFTRYALDYQPDHEHFGREKRLSPEQTLLYDRSDCEDRAALFYCLVKEIYDLPMIVLAFPHHLTVAVKFDKPVGRQVVYNGSSYSVCEPTPQASDLAMGELSPELRSETFEVAYAYNPGKH